MSFVIKQDLTIAEIPREQITKQYLKDHDIRGVFETKQEVEEWFKLKRKADKASGRA